MAEDKQTFFLDLDIAEFTEKALHAKGSITSLGDSENLIGLTEGLLKASAGLAAVGIVAYSLKTTLDLVFDGEKIAKANRLFETLAGNIGVAADKLKDDLVGAAHGLATDTEIIGAANKALVEMGGNAAKIPQVMELARKLTTAFGGDLISRFEQINYAIASGSTRMLKQNGIMIDAQKAVKDFAAAHGVAAEMVTEAGRRQAILNAALEYGEKRLSGLDAAQKTAITSSQQFKVAIKEIGEMFVIAFEKIAGPTVRKLMESLADAARYAKNQLVAAFGGGAEQAAAKVEVLKVQLESNKRLLAQMEKDPGFVATGANALALKKTIADITAALKLEQEMEEETRRKKNSQAVQKSGGKAERPSGGDGELVDHKKIAAEKARIANEILKLQEEHAKRRIEMADNEEELENARQERYKTMSLQHQQQIADVERLWQEKKIINQEQYVEMKKQIDQQFVDKIRATNEQLDQEDDRMEKNKLKRAKNTFDGIQKAAQVSASKANRALHDFGAQGMKTMDTLNKRGSEAFMQMGKAAIDSSMSASEIMKGFFLNSLADIAQSYGELYMLAGIGGDYAKLAAGAALLALSGALRGLAGSAGDSGGGGGSIGSFSGGGDSGGPGFGGGDLGASSTPAPEAVEKKNVTVQIMGSYFESDQTKTHLMDMLREVTDATDFKYQQIGGGT